MGLDRAYDLFQCLVNTGMAKWQGAQKIALWLYTAVYEDGKVVPKKVKNFTAKKMSWNDFCEMVHNKGQGRVKGPDIEQLWRNMMTSGLAIQRFYQIQARKGS
jgi:hypothetical protein